MNQFDKSGNVCTMIYKTVFFRIGNRKSFFIRFYYNLSKKLKTLHINSDPMFYNSIFFPFRMLDPVLIQRKINICLH